MMGNWQCESGLEANRVQGDFSSYRNVSKSYTESIINGSLSRDAFSKDAKGYGLAQWTYWSRKAALYDFAKARGARIDDPILQTLFALSELMNDYSGLLSTLRRETDLYTCTKLICTQFERPAVNNIDARFAAAQQLKGRIDLSGKTATDAAVKPQEAPQVIQTQPAKPKAEFWPPRVLCKGMKGKDVEVLCSLLKVRGYAINFITDEFTDVVEEAVKAFQGDHGLAVDGMPGPMTWAELLKLN